MIDHSKLPYRPCAGVMLANRDGRVFVGQRLDTTSEAWQMPQGGIDDGEDAEEAAIRELGEETGVHGGLVEIIVHELHVACLAENLPDTIVVDVSSLELGQALHVSDIALPKGVKADSDPALVVVLCAEPKVAVEADAAAGPAEPEVLREKKPAESK